MAPSRSSSGGWSGFAKNIIIPLSIALFLYLLIFQAILPLYRHYRTTITRYSTYTPLDQNSLLARRTQSIFQPLIIDPSRSLWRQTTSSIRLRLWRWAVPGLSHMDFAQQDTNDFGEEMLRGTDTDTTTTTTTTHDQDADNTGAEDSDFSDDDNDNGTNRDDAEVVFDDYTANQMTGFDIRNISGDGRRFNLPGRRSRATSNADNTRERDRSRPGNNQRGMQRRQVGRLDTFRLGLGGNRSDAAGGGGDLEADDSNRRLSRELEEGFRDDSGSEDDLVDGVTVGRRNVSRNRPNESSLIMS